MWMAAIFSTVVTVGIFGSTMGGSGHGSKPKGGANETTAVTSNSPTTDALAQQGGSGYGYLDGYSWENGDWNGDGYHGHHGDDGNCNPPVVPEPITMASLAMAVSGIGLYVRKRRASSHA